MVRALKGAAGRGVERQAFIANLLQAASAPGGVVLVALTLRADFYGNCAPYTELREALAAQQEYLGPMTAAELRRAIEEPAQRGGWTLEPGLADVVLKGQGADGARGPEPGALPLLSHALLETWQRRRGRTLTVSGYLAAGGMRGAIGETSEVVYHDELDPEQQAAARGIFLRLTELSEASGLADTRRRASLDELVPRPEAAALVRQVLARLAGARLTITAEGRHGRSGARGPDRRMAHAARLAGGEPRRSAAAPPPKAGGRKLGEAATRPE